MAFLSDLAHSFTTNTQSRTRYTPKWRLLNNNFSHQGEKASRIGDRSGHNFEPCNKIHKRHSLAVKFVCHFIKHSLMQNKQSN